MHGANEVFQLGVLPLVLGEVNAETLGHDIAADHIEELLEEGGTLAVGDTVEKVLCLVCGVDYAGDGMGRGEDVVVDTPEFVLQMDITLKFLLGSINSKESAWIHFYIKIGIIQ
jgi:hypothetical protein